MTVRALAIAAVVIAFTGTAAAHPAQTSAVYVDFTTHGATLELHTPVDQLELAIEHPLDRDPAGRLTAGACAELAGYVAAHLAMTDDAGAALALRVTDVADTTIDDQPYVVTRATLTAAPGATLDRPVLTDDVVLHRVVTHKTLVMVRSDAERPLPVRRIDPGEPLVQTILRYQHPSIELYRRRVPAPVADDEAGCPVYAVAPVAVLIAIALFAAVGLQIRRTPHTMPSQPRNIDERR